MKVRRATSEEWDEFAVKDKAATFFHTRAWYQLWKEYLNWEYKAYLISLDNGKQALLPISKRKVKRGLLRVQISSPGNNYGGFLVKETFNHLESQQLWNYLTNQQSMMLRHNPFQDNIKSFQGWMEMDYTHVIPLQKTWEQIFLSWKQRQRNAYRKGIKEGIQVRVANTPEDWENYYAVYQTLTQYRGKGVTVAYEKRLFQLLEQLPNNQCKLWLATYNGQIIYGNIHLYQGVHVAGWLGGGLKSFYSKKPNVVLLGQAIQHALTEDFHWFDLNPTNKVLLGTMKFKERLGTTKLEAPTYSKDWRLKLINDGQRAIKKILKG